MVRGTTHHRTGSPKLTRQVPNSPREISISLSSLRVKRPLSLRRSLENCARTTVLNNHGLSAKHCVWPWSCGQLQYGGQVAAGKTCSKCSGLVCHLALHEFDGALCGILGYQTYIGSSNMPMVCPSWGSRCSASAHSGDLISYVCHDSAMSASCALLDFGVLQQHAERCQPFKLRVPTFRHPTGAGVPAGMQAPNGLRTGTQFGRYTAAAGSATGIAKGVQYI